jgi:hypothetical protein
MINIYYQEAKRTVQVTGDDEEDVKKCINAIKEKIGSGGPDDSKIDENISLE